MYNADSVTYATLAIPHYDRCIVRKVQAFCKRNSFYTDESVFATYENWSYEKAVAKNGIPALIVSCSFNNSRQGKYEFLEKFIREELHRQPIIA